VYKTGDRNNASNYRPISVLLILGKLLEKIMYNRLCVFLDKHSIIYKYQYGFRSKYSTNIALAELVNTLLNDIDKGKKCIGIFVDFRKAFDTVNHFILLKKLHHYGVRGKIHSWFNSYLTKREQFVQLGDVKSTLKKVTF
jgi:hypothetical protein